MKKLVGKFENQDTRKTRNYSVQLMSQVAERAECLARSEGKTVDQLLRQLVTKTVEDMAEPLEARVRKFSGLIREIAISIRKTPMQEVKDRKSKAASADERDRRRKHLVELGLEAYDEIRKIASSERVSKESEARLKAFTVMARLGMFNAAVIRDEENDQLGRLIAELEENDYEFGESLKKMEKERKEEEG